MNKLIAGVAAAALSFAVAQAEAAQIGGAFSMSGGFAGTGGTNLSDNTGIDFSPAGAGGAFAVTPGSQLGDFAGFLSDFEFGTIKDFTFSPFGGTIASFWAIDIFSFDLETIAIGARTANSLTLTGTGTMHGVGFDDTPGVWIFTGNSAGGSFSFSASAASNVPEPATLALFGAGLLGLGMIGRRKA